MNIQYLMVAILITFVAGICQAAVPNDSSARNTGIVNYSGSLILADTIYNTKEISGYAGRRININTGEHRFTDEIVGTNPRSPIKIIRNYFMGIKEIRWSEKKDKPCAMLVRTQPLDLTIEKSSYETVSLCGTGNSDKTVEFRNPRYFLRGIAACMTDKKSSSKNRLKGIRIYPARVAANGNVTSLNTFESEQRLHCKTWFPAVFCNEGDIASGINVYHEDDVFRGLGLRCRRVERLKSTFR